MGGNLRIELKLTVPQTVVLAVTPVTPCLVAGKGIEPYLIGHEPSVLPYTISAIF